jgi:hypothetical protein
VEAGAGTGDQAAAGALTGNLYAVNKKEREEILRKITEMKEFALFGRTGPNLDTLCDILRAIVRALPRTEKERIG